MSDYEKFLDEIDNATGNLKLLRNMCGAVLLTAEFKLHYMDLRIQGKTSEEVVVSMRQDLRVLTYDQILDKWLVDPEEIT